MDVWSWICQIPNSDEWSESNSPLVYELASSKPTGHNTATQSIQLRAERTCEPNANDVASVTFSVCLRGFHSNEPKIRWDSDACPLSSSDDKPFIPLVSKLVEEIISRSPTAHNDSTIPRSRLQKLLAGPIAQIIDFYSPESFSSFFNLIFLTRLFWLCACDAPSEVGSLYFKALLAPNLAGALSCGHVPVLRSFLISIGVDAELRFMRSLGYMLAKWLVLREMGVGLLSLTPSPYDDQSLAFSYATEAHALWVLKGYAPVLSMKRTRSGGEKNDSPAVLDAKESVLRYALAHQQLEAVIQLEYSVRFFERYVQVKARVDNLRFHVAKLVFSNTTGEHGDDFADEKHFPSRIRVWVGPELGSTYVTGLTLTRSTDNVEREQEMQKSVRGNFGKLKVPSMVATATTVMRARTKNWRWDQDAEGNAAVFDAVLCDGTSGFEVATWKAASGDRGGDKPANVLRRRYAGANRPFGKTGGLVLAADEHGQEVTWRLGRDVGGSVLKWRIGAQVWMTYWPNSVKSSHCETRSVEWCNEVDLCLGFGN